MKARLTTLLALALLALGIQFALPAAVSATVAQGSACSTASTLGTTRVCLAESWVLTGDKLNTNVNIPDLRNVAHTLSGTCNATVKVGDDWNNCISSISWAIPSGKMICFYDGANYGGTTAFAVYATSGRVDHLENYGWQDKFSSLRFRNQSDGCF